MSTTFSLGSIRGIPIGVNWSVLLIAGLIVLSLARQILPAQVRGLDDVAYWIAAALVALLFFGSLLGHELAHAVVARREGLRVEGITLWLLGGVARMSGEPPSAGAEARISGVGPLTSLGFGLIFGVIAVGLTAAAGGELVALMAASAGWLAFVNIVLAVFNLLPGVPLDGGRLARSILWRLRGDKVQATRWATWLGQILGYAMVGLGIIRFFLGDVGAFWFVLLGFFLSSAAGAERANADYREALAEVRVGDVMTNDLPRVPGMLRVGTFVDAARSEEDAVTWLVSGPGGSIVGIVGLDQLGGRRAIDRRDERIEALAAPIESIAVVGPDELLTDLLARFEGDQPALAVVRAHPGPYGEILGFVVPEAVTRAIRSPRASKPDAGSSPGADTHEGHLRP